MNREAFEKGLKTRREVLGADYVDASINNGLTKGDIQEVFLQTAIYCGVPAAIDSFRNAKEVFKEMGI